MSASGGMLSLFSILTVVADSRTHTGDKQYRTYTPQTHTHTHTHTHIHNVPGNVHTDNTRKLCQCLGCDKILQYCKILHWEK